MSAKTKTRRCELCARYLLTGETELCPLCKQELDSVVNGGEADDYNKVARDDQTGSQ